MPGWEDEPLGAFGSGSQIPTNDWFPVNTQTGEWGTPTPTISSVAGGPDLTAPALPGVGGLPDIGHQAIDPTVGAFASKPLGPQPAMRRVQRLDEMGALTRQPGMWETIARGVGMLSPQGRGILQASDQQQQQDLQNRLVMRRQALQEQQDERAQIRERLTSFANLGQIKNKALRNLYADRLAKEMQDSGEQFPADFLETFKKSNLEEGAQMTKFITPLLQDLGMDPAEVATLVESGNFDKIMPFLELAQKVKKDKTEQTRLAALNKLDEGDTGTLGDVSGQAVPAVPAVPGAPTAPGTPTAAAPGKMPPAPKEIEADIAEAHRLYPQVRTDLIRATMLQESYFFPEAKGSAGEIGLMQLKPGTAKDLGVDPYDRRQNVIGGTKYLAQQLTRYGGNEARALAAYNQGPGNVPTEGPIPEKGQSYAQQVLGHTTRGAQPPDTRMQVAGPAAPAPPQTATGGTPQEQAQLTAYNTRIATLENNIARASAIGGEEGRARASAWERQRDNLAKERDTLQKRIQEPGDIERRKQIEEPYELRKAEAAKALTPIDPKTQEVLATNKSIYRSIGKIEDYFREGTDLPPDFVTLVAQNAPGIAAWLQADPKNVTGLAQQWETTIAAAAKNDPQINRFLSALGNMRDLIIKERSGGAVSGSELSRAVGAFSGSLPHISQAFSLFVNNLATVKETIVDSLVTAGAAARPLSGGKAMYGTLPKAIRDRIDYAERGEDYPKAQMPQKPTPPKGQVGGPVTVVAP